MSKRLLQLVTVLAVSLITSASHAALTLSLQPVTPGVIQAGQIDPINLVLTGTRTAVIASIELQFSALTGGASFTSVSPNTDGFAESTALNTYLNTTVDGSLKDNLFLSYAAGPGVDGIPVGSDNFVVGTLFVQTPAGAAGSFPVGLSFADLLSSAVTDIPVQTTGFTVQTVVPEPALTAIVALLPTLALSRRRRVHQ